MKNRLDIIITEIKETLREAIILENKTIEDKLLSILTNTKLLEKELEQNKAFKKTFKKDQNELEKEEIEKIKRRVPKWKEKKNQTNYKILKAFMDLSNNGKHTVNIISLERYLNLNDSKKFLGHYNQLKSISLKNHGKVFQENEGQITLWEPVKEFIIEVFERKG